MISTKDMLIDIIEKTDNEKVLKDMLSILNEIYLLFINGRWDC